MSTRNNQANNAHYLFYMLASDMFIRGVKQYIEQLFPPLPKIYYYRYHPVWRRGSLVCHQPIEGGTIEYRLNFIEHGDDRSFEDAGDNHASL